MDKTTLIDQSSNNRSSSMENQDSILDVAIVGGGVSGLYAAQLLRRKGKQRLVVLEAYSELGGRVRTLPAKNFGPIDLDLGAHFIHGAKNNVIVEIGKQQNWNIVNLGGWPDYHSIPVITGKVIIDNADDRVPMIKKIREHLLLMEESATKGSANHGTGLESDGLKPASKKDMTIAEYLRTKKTPEWAIRLADASIANDYGACIETVGVNASAWEHANWEHGPDYLSFKDEPFTKIVNFLAQGIDAKTNWQALSIDYTDSEYVKIHGRDRTTGKLETVIAKQVIVTVSVPILRNGDLKFVPPLPLAKQRALKRLGFGNALKVFLKFSERVWPVDCYDIVCSEDGAFIPEYWFEEATDSETGKKYFIATAFAAGHHADYVASFGEKEIIKRCLQHLDRLFRGRAFRMKQPATEKYVGGMVFNWAKEEFVQGGYSHPILNREGCNVQDVRTVSRPIQGRVFFAGEATNEKLNPTVNGAMSTSERVVSEMTAVTSSRL